MIFGETEHAHGHHGHVEAVGNFAPAEGQTFLATFKSVPTVDKRTPTRMMPNRLEHGPRASTNGEHQAEHHQREIVGGAEKSAILVSGAAMAAITTVATHPAMNEPMAAMPSATPARPFFAIW